MKMGGVASFLGFLLFLAAFADSARDFFMPSADDAEGTHPFMDSAHTLHELEKLFKNESPPSEGSQTDFCHSCLEISRKAKKILSEPAAFEEIATTICHSAPADLEAQCTKMAETYKPEALMFLQEIAVEEKFCNNTGFCPDMAQENSLPTSSDAKSLSHREHLNEMMSKLHKELPMEAVTKFLSSRDYLTDVKIPLELKSNKTCNTCNNVLAKIRNELEDPDRELKIIASLLKACETEVFVYRCKRLVFAYGPIVISNLQKLVSMDLCRMVHICVDPKNQTTHVSEPYGRRLPSTIAEIDLM